MIEKVLGWIKKHSPSGVLNWHNGQLYPEVSGYLIPTLLKYSEEDLARQYADYLLSVQHEDGSFDGVDGKVRIFDTSACYEGLDAIGESEAADRTKEWLQAQYLNNGALPIEPGGDLTHVYTIRASGLINSRLGKKYWQFEGDWDTRWESKQRAHYLAYGLEGLDTLGVDIGEPLQASQAVIRNGLMPYWVREDWKEPQGTDISATCQMSVLYNKYGLDSKPMIAAVERLIRSEGGVPQTKDDNWPVSWAAKYYLDAKYG